MNLFLMLFAKFIQFAPSVVLGIESIHGSAVKGASKMDLAQQALTLAAGVSAGALTGDNAKLAAVAATVAQTVLQTTYEITKRDGTLGQATAASANLSLDQASAVAASLGAAPVVAAPAIVSKAIQPPLALAPAPAIFSGAPIIG